MSTTLTDYGLPCRTMPCARLKFKAAKAACKPCLGSAGLELSEDPKDWIGWEEMERIFAGYGYDVARHHSRHGIIGLRRVYTSSVLGYTALYYRPDIERVLAAATREALVED